MSATPTAELNASAVIDCMVCVFGDLDSAAAALDRAEAALIADGDATALRIAQIDKLRAEVAERREAEPTAADYLAQMVGFREAAIARGDHRAAEQYGRVVARLSE